MNSEFSSPNAKGHAPVSESEPSKLEASPSDPATHETPAGDGLCAPTWSRFVYSVESSKGELVDEVAIHVDMVPSRYLVKYVFDMLDLLSKGGYLNDELKFSASEPPSEASFSKIFTKQTESLAPEIMSSSDPKGETPLDSKNSKNLSSSEDGHKKDGSEESALVNVTPLKNGADESRSHSSSSGILSGSDSIGNVFFCETVEAARPIPGPRSRLQSKESNHGSQETHVGYRVERADLFSRPLIVPVTSDSGVAPCPQARRRSGVRSGVRIGLVAMLCDASGIRRRMGHRAEPRVCGSPASSQSLGDLAEDGKFSRRTPERRHRRTPARKPMDKSQDPEAAETVQTTNDQAVDLPRIVRQFSQDGYALVENRTAALPITLGFELTTWEAERSLKELRSKVGDEFYQEIHIVRATLKFSLPNV